MEFLLTLVRQTCEMNRNFIRCFCSFHMFDDNCFFHFLQKMTPDEFYEWEAKLLGPYILSEHNKWRQDERQNLSDLVSLYANLLKNVSSETRKSRFGMIFRNPKICWLDKYNNPQRKNLSLIHIAHFICIRMDWWRDQVCMYEGAYARPAMPISFR